MKKNKKLFAILTLVAFMMTLVPALAFATGEALTGAASANGEDWVLTVAGDNADGYDVYKLNASGKISANAVPTKKAVKATETVVIVNAAIADKDVYGIVAKDTAVTSEIEATAKYTIPDGTKAAADQAVKDNAAEADRQNAIDNQSSYIYTVKSNPTVYISGDATESDTVDVTFALNDSTSASVDNAYAYDIIVWAQENGSNVASSALKATGAATGDVVVSGNTLQNAVKFTNVKDGAEKTITFTRGGKYTIHAAVVLDSTKTSGSTQAEYLNNLSNKLGTDSSNNTVTVEVTASSVNDYRLESRTNDGSVGQDATYKNGEKSDSYYDENVDAWKNGATIGDLSVTSTNVTSATLKYKLIDKNGKALTGKKVSIETNSSNLTVSDSSITTNALGTFEFDVEGAREGNYKIYISCGSFTTTVNVTIGATSAAYINVSKEVTNPVDLAGASNLNKIVEFTLTDINGNLVTADKDGLFAGATNAKKADTNYVSILSKPAASNLKNSDLSLIAKPKTNGTDNTKATISLGSKTLSAEGTYVFKVALDNGNYATATVEVKEFTTPTSILLTYTAPSVELGGTARINDLKYVDANGVTKDCLNYVSLAANGYAIQNFDAATGDVKVKTDEKYLGSAITVTAVDERYNLTASADLKVVAEAAALSFSTDAITVNNNNTITVSLVDSEGNRVALSNNKDQQDATISYVILDRPEGAKVSANTAAADNNLLTSGTFKMNLVSSKEGKVTVQVMAKVTNRAAEGSANQVTKYYTGTQTFTVGKEAGTKTQVVMSIGSHELVKNGVVSTIDAAPMIQDNRTFVPFRALAEAFGATVEFDATNNTVTAKLDGTTVVLTIGSSVMTVGDEAKTLDVAPFISGDRTMVPIRAVAEAFGFNVEATSNPDGTTADVVFTK